MRLASINILGLHVTKIDSARGESIGSRRPAYASTMPKNRIVKPPSNGLIASQDKILASLACFSHTSDWHISLRILETITPSGADNKRYLFSKK